MFAIITVAIISGSVAGKMKYVWFLAFATLWHTCVYAPLAHWIFFNGGELPLFCGEPLLAEEVSDFCVRHATCPPL